MTETPPADTEVLREEIRGAVQAALRGMAFDWYCPKQPTLSRRDCLDCITEVATDTLLPVIEQREKALREQIEEEIGNRDQAFDLLDRFAAAIAPESVIGEHSSANDPWANALELVTSHAEVQRLQERIDKALALCDLRNHFAACSATGRTPIGPCDCPLGLIAAALSPDSTEGEQEPSTDTRKTLLTLAMLGMGFDAQRQADSTEGAQR